MDSDIVNLGNGWHEAFSNGIVYSTMLNAQSLADGATTIRAQWPEAGLQDIEIEGLKIPRGRLIKLNQRQEQ